eukprot:IDg22152t1
MHTSRFLVAVKSLAHSFVCTYGARACADVAQQRYEHRQFFFVQQNCDRETLPLLPTKTSRPKTSPTFKKILLTLLQGGIAVPRGRVCDAVLLPSGIGETPGDVKVTVDCGAALLITVSWPTVLT